MLMSDLVFKCVYVYECYDMINSPHYKRSFSQQTYLSRKSTGLYDEMDDG